MPKPRHLWAVLTLLFPLVAAADQLNVGLGELDYPPFYFVENGKLRGAAVEIAEQVADTLDHDLEYHRFPWARVQYFLRSGQVDMAILYFKTEERARDVVYTDAPHLFESSYLAVPKHLDIEFDGDLKDLSEFSFLAVRGYWHGEQFDQADYLHKIPVNNEEELLKSLATRRNFIGVGNKPALSMYAETLGVRDKIRFLSPPIDRGPNYIAFSKAHPDAETLAAEFTEALKLFMKTDDYRAILDKYNFD